MTWELNDTDANIEIKLNTPDSLSIMRQTIGTVNGPFLKEKKTVNGPFLEEKKLLMDPFFRQKSCMILN